MNVFLKTLEPKPNIESKEDAQNPLPELPSHQI